MIRTADGSEIIVLNGSLISNQVTNWTFSDRVRAIEISVNILPGTDSPRVVEVLKIAAANYPGIAKEPAPQVYVLSFTAGASTFQARLERSLSGLDPSSQRSSCCHQRCLGLRKDRHCVRGRGGVRVQGEESGARIKLERSIYPEGIEGLSPVFQPRVQAQKGAALKG